MKKMTKIFSLVMVLVLVCLVFASCAKTLSGTYSAKLDVAVASSETSYTFSGKKVTIEITTGLAGFEKTVEFEGTYEIEDDKITFTFEGDGEDYSGTVPFEKTDDGIKIAGIEYKKQ